MLRDSAYIWISPLIAMVVAQLLKPLLIMIRLRRWDWARMRQSGGMPSSHTALVTALVTELWLRDGGRDPVFAIALFVAGVVMYDAAGVRWQTGRQAAVLNRLLHDLRGQSSPIRESGIVGTGPHVAARALESHVLELHNVESRTVEPRASEGEVKQTGPIRPLTIVQAPWWLVDWPVLNEHVGHKPTEVLGGLVVGLGIALYLH
ncbi:MAG: divergent PAP2 family protein [Alicyclobacillus sp.]|nr:divergent PAP2 family protein [Alicyclobacillus sp.]